MQHEGDALIQSQTISLLTSKDISKIEVVHLPLPDPLQRFTRYTRYGSDMRRYYIIIDGAYLLHCTLNFSNYHMVFTY